MGKIEISKVYIVIAAIVICVLTAFLIRFFFNQRKVQAFISPSEIFAGESITYSDSTNRADSWRWEFGNGDVIFDRNGTYRYPAPGVYQVRLTVDESLQKEFFVNVKEPIKLERDSLVRIIAPEVAVQGELVPFRGDGVSNDWRWSFGETKMIDSRDQVAIYAYSTPGVYEVELLTNETKYPVKHRIEILPGIEEVDNSGLVLSGNDIRERLQAIADGKPFNPNYNHIVSNYLCNNQKIPVTINGNKRNDFYSYCQGLKIMGRNTTIIEVDIVANESSPNCIQKLIVTQTSDKD